jgi:hypothetical protein
MFFNKLKEKFMYNQHVNYTSSSKLKSLEEKYKNLLLLFLPGMKDILPKIDLLLQKNKVINIKDAICEHPAGLKYAMPITYPKNKKYLGKQFLFLKFDLYMKVWQLEKYVKELNIDEKFKIKNNKYFIGSRTADLVDLIYSGRIEKIEAKILDLLKKAFYNRNFDIEQKLDLLSFEIDESAVVEKFTFENFNNDNFYYFLVDLIVKTFSVCNDILNLEERIKK